ncbi:MAG: type II toxin-antitoxin system HicB family antitoxin [Acidimicrobiaceae bacterium]|nr:type II toxin-antitoxin system HicB family antitoxin [Acidimicrobiaceae bacterium]
MVAESPPAGMRGDLCAVFRLYDWFLHTDGDTATSRLAQWLEGPRRKTHGESEARLNYTAGMALRPTQSPLERWLDAALAGALTERVHDDDGVLVGWWAENPRCPGASSFGATPEEALSKLREVLAGWVELGQKLGHSIPSFHEGSVTVPA